MSRVCVDHLHLSLVVPQVCEAEGAISPAHHHQVWLVRVPVQTVHGNTLT